MAGAELVHATYSAMSSALQRQEAGGGGADIGRQRAVAVGVLGRALGHAELAHHRSPRVLGLELGGMFPD